MGSFAKTREYALYERHHKKGKKNNEYYTHGEELSFNSSRMVTHRIDAEYDLYRLNRNAFISMNHAVARMFFALAEKYCDNVYVSNMTDINDPFRSSYFNNAFIYSNNDVGYICTKILFVGVNQRTLCCSFDPLFDHVDFAYCYMGKLVRMFSKKITSSYHVLEKYLKLIVR